MMEAKVKKLGLWAGVAAGVFIFPMALFGGASIPVVLSVLAFVAGLTLEQRAVADDNPI